jgi:acyl-CoA hydrolase
MSTEPQGKRVTASHTTMTQMIMPNDTNPMGNLMGGNLLRWMDIATGICAGKHCEKTRRDGLGRYGKLSSKPIRLGDVITLEASVTRTFRTSVEVFVEVYASDIKGHNPRRCNAAYYTFRSP